MFLKHGAAKVYAAVRSLDSAQPLVDAHGDRVVPVLQANGGGVFGQLNSVVSLKSFSAFSTYSASKAASYSYT